MAALLKSHDIYVQLYTDSAHIYYIYYGYVTIWMYQQKLLKDMLTPILLLFVLLFVATDIIYLNKLNKCILNTF